MAFALPAGLAAALHDPQRGAVAMTGDGGLMMCMGELVTAAQQQANLTVIVFNDGSLSLIDIKRQEIQLPDLGFSWNRPDFAAAARGFGCTAWRVTDAAELEDALNNAAATSGPCLIDVHLDPDGYIEQMRALRG
jgi:acetolactate synthase-1/2/3 large subunit